jgi:uncharacterized coiled-coil protein SlyX
MEHRILVLEERLAYLEKGLRELDAVVTAVARDVDEIKNELRQLREQVADGPEGPGDKYEKPPHY